MTKSKTPMKGKVQKPNGIRCVQCSLNTSSINWLLMKNHNKLTSETIFYTLAWSTYPWLQSASARGLYRRMPSTNYSDLFLLISERGYKPEYLAARLPSHAPRYNVATIFPDADFDWLGGRSKRPRGHESPCFHHRPPPLTLPAQQTRRKSKSKGKVCTWKSIEYWRYW